MIVFCQKPCSLQTIVRTVCFLKSDARIDNVFYILLLQDDIHKRRDVFAPSVEHVKYSIILATFYLHVTRDLRLL